MFEEDDDELFDSQFHSELERYEQMMASKDAYYFDAEVLERIVDHFIIKNHLKKALNAIEFGMGQHPSCAVFNLRRAQIFSTTGKLKESLLILQELEKTEPFNTEVFITKASVFSQLRDHKKAIKYFEKAIETAVAYEDGEDIEDIRFDLALEYENINDFASAIKTLQKILDGSPQNEAAIYEIAYCYERTGDFDKCVEYYSRYIDNNPYSFTAWYNLGNIYFLKNNVEKALWAYDYSTIINDEFASAHFNMGNTYMQVNEYEKALEAYSKCLEIDGDDALTLSYLAEAYERLERYEEAIDYYNQAKEINPELAEPWLGIGIILELQGDATHAINYLNQAVRLQPENANYRLVLGEALYNAGRLVEAETELERALQLEPEYSDAVLLVTRIKAEFNEAEALDYLIRLENLDSLAPKVRILMAAYLWRDGQKMESLLTFKKEYLLDKEMAKTLFLYLPEAEFIPDFVAIIDDQDE